MSTRKPSTVWSADVSPRNAAGVYRRSAGRRVALVQRGDGARNSNWKHWLGNSGGHSLSFDFILFPCMGLLATAPPPLQAASSENLEFSFRIAMDSTGSGCAGCAVEYCQCVETASRSCFSRGAHYSPPRAAVCAPGHL